MAIGKYARFFVPSHELSEDEKSYFEGQVRPAPRAIIRKDGA
jgi:hypothetical protein